MKADWLKKILTKGEGMGKQASGQDDPSRSAGKENPHAPEFASVLQEAETRVEEQNAALQAVMQRNEELEAALQEALTTNGHLEARLQEAGSWRKTLAGELIAYRDRILLRADMARSEADPRMDPLFSGLSRESAMLLERAGIEEIPAAHAFDPAIHMVVDTRETDDPELADHVASVHRPGYRAGGLLLRPQEVILYRYKPTLSRDMNGGGA